MTKGSWYKIVAAKEGEDDASAEILIYDEIGRNWWGEGISAEDLVKELAELDVASISVRINSAGGQVFEGLAIFNALDRHPAEVTTHVDGMAASIASIVALAGDDVRIAENAFMMIHNPWGVAIGDANEMRSMAEILDNLAGSLADIYSKKTGTKQKAIRVLMDAETWFNAAEALEAGLVDEVDAAMAIAASFDLSRFQNVPSSVADRAMPKGGDVHLDARRDGVAAGDSAAIAAGLEAIAAADDNALDPELIRLAAETEQTLSRTLL